MNLGTYYLFLNTCNYYRVLKGCSITHHQCCCYNPWITLKLLCKRLQFVCWCIKLLSKQQMQWRIWSHIFWVEHILCFNLWHKTWNSFIFPSPHDIIHMIFLQIMEQISFSDPQQSQMSFTCCWNQSEL